MVCEGQLIRNSIDCECYCRPRSKTVAKPIDRIDSDESPSVEYRDAITDCFDLAENMAGEFHRVRYCIAHLFSPITTSTCDRDRVTDRYRSGRFHRCRCSRRDADTRLGMGRWTAHSNTHWCYCRRDCCPPCVQTVCRNGVEFAVRVILATVHS